MSSKTLFLVSGASDGGDGRGPAPNDPKATYRAELQLVIDPVLGTVKLVKDDAGTSRTWLGPFAKGASETESIKPTTDMNGTTHFTVNNRSLNGLWLLPFAPEDSIKTAIRMDVTKDGKVGIEGGLRTGYPSLEIYKYAPNGNITTILQVQEHNPSDLARPDQQIPVVAPK